MKKFPLAELLTLVGKTMGTSDWISVDQSRIDQFADCTGDHQWIHVDVDRARREAPSGGTIAHGFLTLAFVAPLSMELGMVPSDASAVINYGLDRVRFITPVRCGDRVRLQLSLEGAEPKEGGKVLFRSKATVEIEDVDSPALVAEMLTLVLTNVSSRDLPPAELASPA